MPIRTNRGRAAVYRRLWGWPLRSPRHLVVTLIGVVILAVVIGIVAAHVHGAAKPAATGSGAFDTTTNGSTATSGPASAGNSTASTSPTTASTPVTRLAGPPETPVSAPPAPAALDVISTWGKLWVNHPVGMTNQQWLAQLSPYTTPELLPQMNTVDLGNINATQVTGPPTASKSFTDSVEALLPTNAGQLDITAIDTPQGWLVSAYTGGS
jgi:hypothetical protein